MSTLFQVAQPSEVEPKEVPPTAGRREQRIREGVLAALGHPARLLKVAVLPLWGNNFRVNVWTGGSGSGNTIPHSYFVTADESGSVLRAEPKIEKLH